MGWCPRRVGAGGRFWNLRAALIELHNSIQLSVKFRLSSGNRPCVFRKSNVRFRIFANRPCDLGTTMRFTKYDRAISETRVTKEE